MIRSNSWEGRSETVVEFNLSNDMTRATQDVRDKVAVVQAGLQPRLKAPFVSRFDGDNAQPTVVLALMANNRSDRELSLIADQTVQKRLTSVEGVARVTPMGLVTRQVRIDFNRSACARSASRRPTSPTASPRPIPTSRWACWRTRPRIRSCASRAACSTRSSSPTSWSRATRAVAWCCWATSASSSSASRNPTHLSRINGKPAVTFNIYKQQDANIVKTGAAIKEAAESMRKTLPPGVELKLIYASSDWVSQSLDGVEEGR